MKLNRNLTNFYEKAVEFVSFTRRCLIFNEGTKIDTSAALILHVEAT